MDTAAPIANAIRLGFIYLFIITLTIIVQSVANKLMKILSNALDNVEFPFKFTITMILLLYIVFAALLIDVLIWTTVVMIAGLFNDFLDAFTFSADNFTTLGVGENIAPPWEFVGPVMSLNGIVIIAFAGSAVYDTLYNNSNGSSNSQKET